MNHERHEQNMDELRQAVRSAMAVTKPSTELRARVARRLAEPARPRRRVGWSVWATAAAALIGVWLVASVLLPSRSAMVGLPDHPMLARVARAAAKVSQAHYRRYRCGPDGKPQLMAEGWADLPRYRQVEYVQGRPVRLSVFTGEAQWEYQPATQVAQVQPVVPGVVPGAAPEVTNLALPSLLKLLQQSEGPLTVSAARGRLLDGRPTVILTLINPERPERMVLHAEADTDRPVRIDVFGPSGPAGAAPAGRASPQNDRAAWVLSDWMIFDYPESLPADLFRFTPPAGVTVERLPAPPVMPSLAELRTAFSRPVPVAQVQGVTVSLLDAAVNDDGDLFVAYAADDPRVYMQTVGAGRDGRGQEMFGFPGGRSELIKVERQPVLANGSTVYGDIFSSYQPGATHPPYHLELILVRRHGNSPAEQERLGATTMTVNAPRRVTDHPVWWPAFDGPRYDGFSVAAHKQLRRAARMAYAEPKRAVAIMEAFMVEHDRPRVYAAWWTLGFVYAEAGRREDAIEAYQTALELIEAEAETNPSRKPQVALTREQLEALGH